MTFAAFLIARMAPVAFAVVDHFKLARIKGGLQAGSDFVCHTHFFAQRKNIAAPLFYFRLLD